MKTVFAAGKLGWKTEFNFIQPGSQQRAWVHHFMRAVTYGRIPNGKPALRTYIQDT